MKVIMHLIKLIFDPGQERLAWRFWRLALLSAAMFTAAYLLARPNQPFFYQGF